MKNMTSLVVVNLLIIVCLLLAFNYSLFYIPLSILIIINIGLIYIKSSTVDKNEKKKKIMLHQVKNSLSVILGYSEAHSDDLITKEELDEKINEEIRNIVTIIKDEIYK